MNREKRDYSNGRMVLGSPKRSDWDGAVEDVARERELQNWYESHIFEERVLLALAGSLVDKLFFELALREDVIIELLGRKVTIIQPEVMGIESSCKPHDARVLLNKEFCKQDEVALALLIARMGEIADNLGFTVFVPLNLRENQFFYINCVAAKSPSEDQTLL